MPNIETVDDAIDELMDRIDALNGDGLYDDQFHSLIDTKPHIDALTLSSSNLPDNLKERGKYARQLQLIQSFNKAAISRNRRRSDLLSGAPGTGAFETVIGDRSSLEPNVPRGDALTAEKMLRRGFAPDKPEDDDDDDDGDNGGAAP